MSFHYKIYGLQVSSSMQITLLEQSDNSDTDLSVMWHTGSNPYQDLLWEQVQTADLKKRKKISFFIAQTDFGTFSKICYSTPEGNLYFVLSPCKTELWITRNETISNINLESYFVGPMLGSILRLRGVLCLHASVIEIQGKAVAFLGAKRSGKSTTAASFASKGYRVLADDVAVITENGGNFYIEPGYSKLRLRQKTAEVIHPEEASSLPLVYSFGDSFYSTLGEKFCDSSLPLAAIYILTLNATNEALTTPVGLSERLVVLGQNTFGNHVITPQTRKQEFEILGRLAKKISVNRLHIVYDIENITSQYEAVIKNYELLNEIL